MVLSNDVDATPLIFR